jgi:hypothetical protein
VVFESKQLRYEMDFGHDDLVWRGKAKETRRFRIQQPEGLEAGTFSVRTTSLIELDGVKVSIERNGKQHKASVVSTESVPWAAYPEFDDEIIHVYTIHDLHVGDLVEVEIERRYKRTWEIPRFLFGDLYPAKHQALEIHLPQDVEIRTHVDPGLLGSPEIRFHNDKTGGAQVLTWEAENVPGLTSLPEDAPDLFRLLPSVFVAATHVTRKGQRIPVRSTWVDFALWYQERVQGLYDLNDELRDYVRNLRNTSADEDDFIRRIYASVQTHVRYVAFSVGEGGWIPRSAAHTFDRKYGDCKDMSTLLVALLREADIPAQLALVLTRSAGGVVRTDFPYALQFNHCVAHVPRDGGTLWLDATGPAPLDDISSFITANPALVIDGANTRFETPRHPDQQQSESHATFELTVAPNRRTRVRFDFEWLGPSGSSMRQWKREVGADELRQHAHRLLSQRFSDVREVSLESVQGARLSGQCSVKQLFETLDTDAVEIPLGMTPLPLPQIARSRSVPFVPPEPVKQTTRVVVTMPFNVREDSRHEQVAEPFATYEVSTDSHGNTLTSSWKLEWTTDLVPGTQLRELRSFVRKARRTNDRMWIVQRL